MLGQPRSARKVGDSDRDNDGDAGQENMDTKYEARKSKNYTRSKREDETANCDKGGKQEGNEATAKPQSVRNQKSSREADTISVIRGSNDKRTRRISSTAQSPRKTVNANHNTHSDNKEAWDGSDGTHKAQSPRSSVDSRGRSPRQHQRSQISGDLHRQESEINTDDMAYSSPSGQGHTIRGDGSADGRRTSGDGVQGSGLVSARRQSSGERRGSGDNGCRSREDDKGEKYCSIWESLYQVELGFRARPTLRA